MYLTICTSTYNKAHTLDRVYKSLLNQNNQQFEWIVVVMDQMMKQKSLFKIGLMKTK